MAVVVVGANHRTAPLELLERMAVDAERMPKLLHGLDAGEHSSEVAVLATCNRTEVYLIAERFHGTYQEVRDFFADLTYLPPERFVAQAREYLARQQGSATAQAAKRLRAGRRLALTGTPIENRLSEIWSIFDYVSPGLLGDLAKFEQRYASPIDRGDASGMNLMDLARGEWAPVAVEATAPDLARRLPPIVSGKPIWARGSRKF